MDAILSVLGSIGIFIAGLVVRFGLLLVVLAILTVVFLAGLAVVRLAGYLRRRMTGAALVDGVLYRPGLYYAPGHIWLRATGPRTVDVGMDDLAQRLFPGLSAVSLPAAGTDLCAGEPVAQVTCGNKDATLRVPVDGRVVAVNERLRRDPALVRRDPYRHGWLVRLEVGERACARFPRGTAAREWLDTEAVRLARFIEGQLSLAAADGGELLAPGPTLLDDEQWQALTNAFLT
jgi:glycine cleavage system H protein